MPGAPLKREQSLPFGLDRYLFPQVHAWGPIEASHSRFKASLPRKFPQVHAWGPIEATANLV